MYAGTVIKWDDARGFGFIKNEDGGPDTFVHFSGILADDERRSLIKGQRVTFKIESGPKGRPQATEVEVVEG